MSTTIIIIGIVLILLFIVVRVGKKKSKNPEKSRNQNLNQSQNLYQKREIKSFSIVGTFYRKLNPNEAGNFIGYVKCERNQHDKYAVAVFKNPNKHIGYTPKGNVKLSESISAWHSGQVLAWGNLRYEEYDQSWYGSINIPVGLTKTQIEKIKESFDLLKKRELIQTKENISKNEYFDLFDDHLKIKENLADLGNETGIYYEFSKKIIPSFSKQLESEKDWESLIKLENYKELITELNEKFANSTLNRIEKAKKNLL
jgi:hypothetical protein